MAQLDDKDGQENIEALAWEIERYLHRREQAADTVVGIARWWLMRQRLQESLENVARAMELLEAKGIVQSRQLPNGELLYSFGMAVQQNNGKFEN